MGKALPADEKEKGLMLFVIVNLSMKRLKRVKGVRVAKPKFKHQATKSHHTKKKAQPGKKKASYCWLKF